MRVAIDHERLSKAIAAAQNGLRELGKQYHPMQAVLRKAVKPNRHERRAAKAKRRGK